MSNEAFPHILTFEKRSHECRLAIFGSATPNEQPPCLPVRHLTRCYQRDASSGVGVAGEWLDCGVTGAWLWYNVLLDCSNAQVAARLNGVIWEHLGMTERAFPLFGGRVESCPHFELGDIYLSLRNPGVVNANVVGWRLTTGRNQRAEYMGLPQLPTLLVSPAAEDAFFWGRVRVMVIEAMDEAKMFEKVSSAG